MCVAAPSPGRSYNRRQAKNKYSNRTLYTHGWSPTAIPGVLRRPGGGIWCYKYRRRSGPKCGFRCQRLRRWSWIYTWWPDIYFNSVRSGLMQNGAWSPTAATRNKLQTNSLNNWFAHISPDGKWLYSFPSCLKETPAGIHPPYKHVYIRLLPIDGKGLPKAGYVYGGQGSITTVLVAGRKEDAFIIIQIWREVIEF